jgi:hypothetical protein
MRAVKREKEENEVEKSTHKKEERSLARVNKSKQTNWVQREMFWV